MCKFHDEIGKMINGALTELDRKGIHLTTHALIDLSKIAQTLLRNALEHGYADNVEVELMLDKDYSKKIFGIDFPLLVPANAEYNPIRYYPKPLEIRGTQYRLCSQWYETSQTTIDRTCSIGLAIIAARRRPELRVNSPF